MSYKQLNTNILIPFIKEISRISNSISRSSINIDLMNKIDILKNCIFTFNRLKDVPYSKIEDLANSYCEGKEETVQGIILKKQENPENGEVESKDSERESIFKKSEEDTEQIKKNKEEIKKLNALSLGKLNYIRKNRWYTYKVDRSALSISDSDSTSVSINESTKSKEKSSDNDSLESIDISSCGFSIHSQEEEEEEEGEEETKSRESVESSNSNEVDKTKIAINTSDSFLSYNIYNLSYLQKPIIDFQVENPLYVSL